MRHPWIPTAVRWSWMVGILMTATTAAAQDRAKGDQEKQKSPDNPAAVDATLQQHGFLHNTLHNNLLFDSGGQLYLAPQLSVNDNRLLLSPFLASQNLHTDLSPGLNLVLSGTSLGASLSPVDDVLRAQLGIPHGQGIVVTGVVPGSPAQKAGIAAYDVLLAAAGKPLCRGADLDEARALQGDVPLAVQGMRQGNRFSVTLAPAVANLSQDVVLGLSHRRHQDKPQYRIGVSLAAADDTLRAQLKLGAKEGLVVTGVSKQGAAEKAGIQKHDVLVKINDHPLKSVGDLQKQVNQSGGIAISVELLRQGRRSSVTVQPSQVSTPQIPDLNLRLLPMISPSADLRLTQPMDLTLIPHLRLSNQRHPSVWLPMGVPHPNVQKNREVKLDDLIKQIDQLRKTVEALQKQSNNKKK